MASRPEAWDDETMRPASTPSPYDRSFLRLRWALSLLLISFSAVRLVLAVLAGASFTLGQWGRILGMGFLFDLGTAACVLVPFALYESLMPVLRSPWARKAERLWAGLWAFGLVFGLGFTVISEFMFWREFSTRFNFIAVDYMLYTREVWGNIRQSYPLGWILGGIGAVSGGILYLTWPREVEATPFRHRLRPLGAVSLLLVLGVGGLRQRMNEGQANAFVGELSSNGVWAFFAAARTNELDYKTFYRTRPDAEVHQDLRRLVGLPGDRFVTDHPQDITRDVSATGAPRRLNVVLISMESFSATFMDTFGGKKHLTPNLDRLAGEGLLYTRLYAVGTRTVRGLEGLSLGIPPIPGQSVVRRPGNEDLATLGGVFKTKGYESLFLYGGYGYFDNMNAYFAGNGYRVVDRRAIPEGRIHHENIWGVADEDLFTLTLEQLDGVHAQGRPFFAHVMTTTNHRPFTYPSGRIDIPSKTSRDGAVKYTDWAVGDFLTRARGRAWFKDTLFVVTADHTAGAAGETDLPVGRYHIPMILFAPEHVAPGRFDRLMSQIDIGPTLLGLLNQSYRSRFLGYDMARLEPGRERAFISTYQVLGLLREGRLVELRPGRQFRVGVPPDQPEVPVGAPTRQLDEAIAWYQGTNELLKAGGLRRPAN